MSAKPFTMSMHALGSSVVRTSDPKQPAEPWTEPTDIARHCCQGANRRWASSMSISVVLAFTSKVISASSS